MMLRIRAYVPDQDQPLQSAAGRKVVAELIEIHGLAEEVVATITGEYRHGDDLPSLTVQLNLTVQHIQLLNFARELLWGLPDDHPA
jgi:hypothetical protein